MTKPLLTTRVTAIQSFNYWLNCQSERNSTFNTEANLIATIKGEYAAGVKADFGTVGHGIIEDPRAYRQVLSNGKWGYSRDGFELTTAQVMPVLQYYQRYPKMVREINVTKRYETNSLDLLITGHIDGLNGLYAHDNKFKFSPYELDEYMDSYQWRLYLDMIGLDFFQYDFFRVYGFESIEDCEKARIIEDEPLLMTRYADMKRDIENLLNEFSDFVAFRKLESYLTITEEKKKTILAGDYRLNEILR